MSGEVSSTSQDPSSDDLINLDASKESLEKAKDRGVSEEEDLADQPEGNVPLSKDADALKDVASSQNASEADVSLINNEARLEQLEKEHETLRSQYMRIAADFDNFRKRQTRDHDDLRLQLTCTTLSEILPVVDNFERARQQLDPQGEEAQALHRSYQGLYKQLVDVLKQLGVAPMRVVGQVFDPNLHEAVLREPSNDHLEDIIIEELQRGYHLNGRVLRHALVKVSMGPGPNVDDKTQSDPIAQDTSSDDAINSSAKED